MGLFELATQSQNTHALSAESNHFDIDTQFLNYMKNLEIELYKSQQTQHQKEVSYQETNKNEDVNLSVYPTYYL